MTKKYVSEDGSFLRRIRVFQDDMPRNPLEEYDMVFKFHLKACWGDIDICSKDSECPIESWAKNETEDTCKRKPGLFALPVYFYNHSGITLRLVPFNDPWDSGLAGFMYVDEAEFCKAFNIPKFDKIKALKVAKEELETIQQWMSGEVFGWIEEKRESPEKEWEKADSCWGFFGQQEIKYALEELKAFEEDTALMPGDFFCEQLFT